MGAEASPIVRGARLRVPASTANLGPGFDALGLALGLHLCVEVDELAGGVSRLDFRGSDAGMVEPGESNLIWRTMTGAAARHGRRLPPFALRVENRIPIGRGLGSSAAAVLAGVAAADFLCRLDLSEAELLAAATEVEGHPDNVAAALLGGLVASVSAGTVLSSRIEFAARWSIVVAIPDFALSTREARAALPAEVPHRDAVFNVQRAAFLIAQLARGRREGVREAMRDRLHQPYRSRLVPGLAEILALDGVPGLVGIALSGAGPSVLAFADGEAEAIGARLRATFAAHGVSAEVRILEPDNAGLVREAREGGAA